jgi:hypothetical protein
MDYEAIRGGLELAIPYNAHLGLRVVEVGPGHATVRLPDDARLRNHVRSQHNSALFSAGELASGGAFAGAFADIITELTPLAESGEIAYHEIALGPIDATGRIAADLDALRTTLDADGAVSFTVEVVLTNAAETPVATMTVQWDVRKTDA